MDIWYYVLFFFTASVLGWMMEVCCKLVQFHRFINRGFLIGPVCPIYGFGAVLVTLLLSPFSKSALAVFALAMVVCGTLEYVTSWAMEKLFHARWWDYSQKKFNLNGRVCADTLIPFGLLGLSMVYVVKPFLFSLFARLPDATAQGVAVALVCVIAADTAVSACVLSKIRKSADNAKGDSTEEITKAVRAALAKQGVLVRRALTAFPFAKMSNHELLLKARSAKAMMKKDIKEAKTKMREDFLREQERIKNELHQKK